jgi:hypothetical protein
MARPSSWLKGNLYIFLVSNMNSTLINTLKIQDT